MPGVNRNTFQERLCLHFYDNEEDLSQHFSTSEADLKVVVGSFSVNNKEYERRELSEGLRRMMRVAEEKSDLAAYARLAKEYKTVNRLDKDDPDPVDTKMVPLSARPVMDPKVLNEKWTDDKIAELKKEAEKRWGKRLAEDVDYEEIDTNNHQIEENDDRDG